MPSVRSSHKAYRQSIGHIRSRNSWCFMLLTWVDLMLNWLVPVQYQLRPELLRRKASRNLEPERHGINHIRFNFLQLVLFEVRWQRNRGQLPLGMSWRQTRQGRRHLYLLDKAAVIRANHSLMEDFKTRLQQPPHFAGITAEHLIEAAHSPFRQINSY